MTQDQITKAFEKVTPEELEGLLGHLKNQKAELAAMKGKTPAQMVQFYLDELAKADPQLAARYPNNELGKTIDNCMSYLQNQASKLKKGNIAMVHHSIVFDWAVEYFLDDNIKAAATAKAKAETKPKMTPEEIKAKIEEWNKAHQQRIDDWIRKHEDKCAKWEAEQKKKIEKWDREHLQISIFEDPNEGTNPFREEGCPYDNETNPFLLEKCPYSLDEASSPTTESNSPDEDDTDEENNDNE